MPRGTGQTAVQTKSTRDAPPPAAAARSAVPDEGGQPQGVAPPPIVSLTLRQWGWAVGLGVFYLWLGALAIRHVELVTGRYVSSGVPPIAAMVALLAAVPLGHLLRRMPPPFPRLVLERRQILIIFSMLCIGTVLNGAYLVRAFLPHLGILHYWPGHGNSALVRWVEYFPLWYAPTDAEAWRQYFEGNQGAGIPWHLWALPLLRWTVFFVALFVVATSLSALFRRQWVQYERLSFPLLYLPLTYTSEGAAATFGGKPLFRHPLLWMGIGLATAFNAINIARALNPSIPAPGFYFSFSGIFPDRPWTPFNTLMLFYMPEAVGFGYFVPLEISFSAWFFYLLLKFTAVAGIAGGLEMPGFPFIQDQSAGAYLGVTSLILYGARRHLASVSRRAFGFARGKDSPDDQDERMALFGLLGGLVVVFSWCWMAGFHLAIAVPFFTILLCFVLVYARLRAETGVPFGFIYPYGLPKDLIVNALTPRGVLDVGGPRSWVAFSGFAWLSRHHYAQEMAAYSIDGFKLADETHIQRRRLWVAMLVALVAGLWLAFWAHLDAYYNLGSNLAGGGSGQGEYRAQVALQEFQRMANLATTNVPRNDAKLTAQIVGCGVAVFLGLLRTVWVKSPFHPLGYILASAYGDQTTIFFPMLMAWGLKSLVLKAGGLRLYRALIPLFLGLVIGHYAVGGVVWPVFSLLLAPEASKSYHIYFGG